LIPPPAAELVALSQGEDSAATADLVARAPAVRARGFLTGDDLEAVRRWKWPPSRGRPSASTPAMVEAATGVALSTACEQLRIEVLTLLDGVAWPVASVVLHFFHPDPYPVLDRLALRALGHAEPPRYDFALWADYTATCRRLAADLGLSMRALDRALWTFGSRSLGV
jgi:hypothetical protein